MEDLENILKNPLLTFDYINSRIWKDPNIPEIKKFISDTREMINKAEDKKEKYMMLVTYMISIRDHALGDGLQFLNNIILNLQKRYN